MRMCEPIAVLMSRSRGSRALRLLGAGRCRPVLPRRALSYPNEPLSQAIDLTAGSGQPRAAHQQSLSPYSHETQITRLENGLRVASQEAFGQYSTVGGEP